jgi:hypothetical protein
VLITYGFGAFVELATAVYWKLAIAIRPIFAEAPINGEHMPTATAEELSRAIFDAVDAGARGDQFERGAPGRVVPRGARASGSA